MSDLDITAFLRARLHEDEQSARACLEEVGSTRAGESYPDGSGVAERDDYPSYPWGAGEAEHAHAARMQPARTLREIEAKRKVIEEYAEALRIRDGYRETGWEEGRREALELACKAFAASYADHPDYREEWKP